MKICNNGGLNPNLPLCCEIGAHMNNSIINWSTFLICNNVDTTFAIVKIIKKY
jgi:hypothetical protein